MSGLFLKAVNISISAGWIVAAVSVLRLLMKKAPKWTIVLLWGIVAVRLICPFNIESKISLIPSAETISPEIMTDKTPEINTGISFLNDAVNPFISGSLSPDPSDSASPLQIWIPVFSVVWAAGIAAMLIYAAVSFLRIKRKVATAVLLCDNIFQSESVVSPFVMGLINPKIFLPFDINEQNMEYVIAHERAHISRKDYLLKPLGFLLLAYYWFNPLIWLGYALFCRDIELACDEKVIKELDKAHRADYSQALLTLSINHRVITACPLAFGEVGIKSRVKSVLSYKKPAFWVITTAVIAGAAAAVCLLTSPITRHTKISSELSVFLDGQIAEHHRSSQTGDNFIAIDYEILDVNNSSDETTVYMWVLYSEYSLKNGDICFEEGAHTPTVVTVKRSDTIGHAEKHYELVEYWTPRDGTYYEGDIKAKFPSHLRSDAFDSQKYIDKQQAFCERSAREYYGIAVSDIGGADKPGYQKTQLVK